MYSYDSSSETLTLAATEGLPTRSSGRVILGKGEGLVGLVVEEGAPVSVEDALSHERFKFFPELGEEKYRAFLGSPVGEGQGIVGVLVLQARRRRRFGQNELSLLRSVANQLRPVMVGVQLAERLLKEEKEREVYRRGMARAIRRLEQHEARSRRRASSDGLTHHGAERMTGNPVSPGIGIGRVVVVEAPADLDHVGVHRGQPEVEAERFEKALADSRKEVEETLAYFDGMSFAERITCPIVVNIGLQDNICPPETGYEVFNKIASEDKRLYTYDRHAHDAGSHEHSQIIDAFFSRHLNP